MPVTPYERYRHKIIYLCEAGSRAYGLDHEGSDVDVRGIYIAPTNDIFGLYRPPEDIDTKVTLSNGKTKETWIWELGKFCLLALKGNPNILETLWSDRMLVDPVFKPFLDNRQAFLSKRIINTYRGYAQSQFYKMGQDERQHGKIRWKHCSHLLRLMWSGIHLLEIGEINLKTPPIQTEMLHRILRGEYTFERIIAEYESSKVEFDQAALSTSLPDLPNEEMVEDMLCGVRWAETTAAVNNDWDKEYPNFPLKDIQ